jgi:putative sterol carrier protein
MDLQYIKTGRNKNFKVKTGLLDRSEFIEYIVRLAKSAYPTIAVDLSLMIIMDLLLKNVNESSTFLSERVKIRKNMHLNKLLYKNKHGLMHIYKT